MELTRPVQDQILREINQLTDVCDVLKSLHIAIGFLSSAGGDPSMSIHKYLHTGLKMTPKNGLKSGKVHLCDEIYSINKNGALLHDQILFDKFHFLQKLCAHGARVISKRIYFEIFRKN